MFHLKVNIPSIQFPAAFLSPKDKTETELN